MPATGVSGDVPMLNGGGWPHGLPSAASTMRYQLFDWQQRVFDEHAELSTRASKLAEFVGGAVFQSLEARERVLMSEQLHHMRAYLDTLTQRISRWF